MQKTKILCIIKEKRLIWRDDIHKIEKNERLQLPSERSLTVEKHTMTGKYPQHWHNYYEIEIILSGSGKYIINDIEHDISANDVFFLNPTDFHHLDVEHVTRLINISFDINMLDDKDMTLLVSEKNRKVCKFDGDERDRLINAANILLHEYETSGDCQKQLLQYVVKCILRKNAIAQEETGSVEQNRGIKRAVAYMETCFTEKITLDDVAAAAGYHPTYFSELFASVTGETYINMLTRLRLSHAKSMLASGSSVSDACFQSGFGSLSNFLEVFKKSCNMTPSQYRRMQSK